jgi:GTP pyrophosphokinase
MERSDFTPEEERLIEDEYQALLRDYLNSMHSQRVEIIERAYHLAKQAHNGVRRLSGEPYMMHPLSVARIVVKEIGLGSTSICAALLHDVVEDTDYTVEDIERMFDKKIATIKERLAEYAREATPQVKQPTKEE